MTATRRLAAAVVGYSRLLGEDGRRGESYQDDLQLRAAGVSLSGRRRGMRDCDPGRS